MTEEREAEAIANIIMALVIECVKTNDLWKLFGLKLPARGFFFDVFFSSERIAKERFLIREFVIVYIASFSNALGDHLNNDKKASLISARLTELLIDGTSPDEAPGIRRIYHFSTWKDVFDYFSSGIRAYLDRKQCEHAVLFIERAINAGISVPKNWRPAALILFTQYMKNVELVTWNLLDESGVIGDVSLVNERYIELFSVD